MKEKIESERWDHYNSRDEVNAKEIIIEEQDAQIFKLREEVKELKEESNCLRDEIDCQDERIGELEK